MSAAAQVSAIREHWPTALRVLQSIPAAVASKSLPRDCLFLNTLQAQLHSSKAVTFTPDYEVAGRPGFNFAPDARKVLVGEFKVGRSCGLPGWHTITLSRGPQLPPTPAPSALIGPLSPVAARHSGVVSYDATGGSVQSVRSRTRNQ